MKQLMILTLALFLMSVSWSQDAEEAEGTETVVAEVSEADDAAEEEIDPELDDLELDEPGYGVEEEEDDFIPSEEVSADQSLPFPVDI
jgi:hypothetical protein